MFRFNNSMEVRRPITPEPTTNTRDVAMVDFVLCIVRPRERQGGVNIKCFGTERSKILCFVFCEAAKKQPMRLDVGRRIWIWIFSVRATERRRSERQTDEMSDHRQFFSFGSRIARGAREKKVSLRGASGVSENLSQFLDDNRGP
jgi:hypothetical protein